MPEHWLIWAVVILAVLFDYINGFHDTANAIATSVSTRAITPSRAILMAAGLNFLGAMVSTGVAKTIGGDLVLDPAQISLEVIIAALIGSIVPHCRSKNGKLNRVFCSFISDVEAIPFYFFAFLIVRKVYTEDFIVVEAYDMFNTIAFVGRVYFTGCNFV